MLAAQLKPSDADLTAQDAIVRVARDVELGAAPELNHFAVHEFAERVEQRTEDVRSVMRRSL